MVLIAVALRYSSSFTYSISTFSPGFEGLEIGGLVVTRVALRLSSSYSFSVSDQSKSENSASGFSGLYLVEGKDRGSAGAGRMLPKVNFRFPIRDEIIVVDGFLGIFVNLVVSMGFLSLKPTFFFSRRVFIFSLRIGSSEITGLEEFVTGFARIPLKKLLAIDMAKPLVFGLVASGYAGLDGIIVLVPDY